MAKWIWLNENDFFEYSSKDNFCILEFRRQYIAEQDTPLTIKVCASARYALFVNDKFVGRGPVSAGLDYFEYRASSLYYDEYQISPNPKVSIKAFVTSCETAMSERSCGIPGLYMEIYQGGEKIGKTDSSWKVRPLVERIDINHTDYTKPKCEFCSAKEIDNNTPIEKSPIEHLFEEKVKPSKFDKIDLNSNTGYAFFDKIYSAYPEISLKTDGEVKILIECAEIDGVGVFKEEFVANKDTVHTSFRMRSVGQIKITLENINATNAEIDCVEIVNSIYPVKNETHFETSDELLNKIHELCTHTLKICRRDLHLDSPTHQEPLACTGDYYIQSLMEYLNIYDPTLTAFDILRTAKMLERQNGEMFHTTYSLIFPQWLYDYYMYTGDKSMVEKCQRAIELLLKKFDTYVGKNGLLEYAPNYMFVDWVLVDENGNNTDPTNMMSHGNFKGYSLHHPPKALGQSVLCMFYYNALVRCADLYEILCEPEFIGECLDKASALRNAINDQLFDSEKGLYKGGLNTPNEIPDSEWLPKNTDKTFYLKQANVLAALFDIAPYTKRAEILDRVCENLKKEQMQPYFYHFLLEALLKEGLFEKYGINLIKRYESLLQKCDKGLCEAWEMFPSDCSHAWGGTPAYILKKAIAGFEMIDPCYKRIKISPNLFGLEFADFEISTPYGPIQLKLTKDEGIITVPDEIEIIRS